MKALTGFYPYMLLFGREPRLPVDLAFGINTRSEETSYTEYVSDLQNKIKDAFQMANKNATESREEKQKKNYDLKARAEPIGGDRVLVKILAHDSKHKSSDKWADEIYVVNQPNSNIPVYKVKREDGKGIEKTLHRNLLLHLGNALQDETNDPVKPIPKPRKQAPKSMPRLERKVFSELTFEKTNSDSVDEDIVFVTTTTTKNNQHDFIDYVAATSGDETVLESGIIEDMGTLVDVDPMVSGDA